MQAFRLLDELADEPSYSKNVDLHKVVEKLAHAAEYGITEGLIQRQRAQDLEKALVRRNQETKSKRQTLTTTLATTGAELLKLRQELDKCHKTPPKASRKQTAAMLYQAGIWWASPTCGASKCISYRVNGWCPKVHNTQNDSQTNWYSHPDIHALKAEHDPLEIKKKTSV